MSNGGPPVERVREHLPRGQALLGLLVATAAAVTLVLRGRPILDGVGGSLLLGFALAGAGGLVGLLGVLRCRVNWTLWGTVLIVLAPTPYRLGLPTVLDWVIALAGALGLAVLLQAMLGAREGASLQDRLGTREDDDTPDRDVRSRVLRTMEHRVNRSRRTLLLAALIVGGAIILTRIVGIVLPEALAASLELRSLYGAVLMVLLAAIGLLVMAAVRRLRAGEDGGDHA